MGEIENAMCAWRDHHNPKGRPEAHYGSIPIKSRGCGQQPYREFEKHSDQ